MPSLLPYLLQAEDSRAYNKGCVCFRPHSALGYRPPAPEATLFPALLAPAPVTPNAPMD